MPVAVYMRVSSEEQRERQSIATQRDFAAKYCDLHQLTVHEIYADDGVPGVVPIESRPGGKWLLEAARRRQFDQILVFKLDRLGRNAAMVLTAVEMLQEYGIRVRSMTEEFDSTTATGRLMLTMLSGFAAHEREVIRERSLAGTNRLVEAGAWLGGIVPYGYRKQGEKAEARLDASDDLIPGFDISEADVVRTIYRMCGTERKSCQKIADFLNRRRIPVGSSDLGKRNRRTAPFWRASHIRNMIVSRTYMGEHRYGIRSKHKNHNIRAQKVPPIVTPELWNKAQLVLKANRIEAATCERRSYLLRGLIKCGLCGLTFCGNRFGRDKDHYYTCNGRTQARGIFGLDGKKCPSKSLNGDYVDRLVWADIECFLRNPGEVLEKLRQRLSLQDGERQRREKELQALNARLEQTVTERDRILVLFRKGRIDEATLDRQLDQVEAEARDLRADIEDLSRELSTVDRAAQLQSAEELLMTLRKRLEGPIPHELQRRIVEVLVEKVEAHTVERWGVPQSQITINYRFSQPSESAALVLPRTFRLSNRRQPPEELNTIGDHLVRRRLGLKLLQRQVAEQLGVDKGSVYNWENNRSAPAVQYMPTIIQFLGYDPMPVPKTWAERLVHARTVNGLTQQEAAKRIGVDQGTLARWERSEREPRGSHLKLATAFVNASTANRALLARTA
jgi:site-specific DNA recombinase